MPYTSQMLDEPLVWTPAAVKAELARVRGVLDAINADVSAATGKGKFTPAEWQSWRQLYEGAHHFVDTASSLWGSNAVQARDYEAQAGKWRKLVVERGQPVTGAGPRDPGPGLGWDTKAFVLLLLGGFIVLKVLDGKK